ncbi:fungal specific transcription factor domain-containing protein [Aspergillus lucknowensis]|uniref:Fungal-specific transcription factor domain-containing protein n=1 Tax=Aspergillus lucknowensis TaxID=176173 RepID=A0ABR4M2W4_9EURO
MANGIFREACDIFFRHYHNKPYTLFNPALFRHKAAHGQIPRYLQFALIATAVRFSSQAQWKQRKQKTIDGYAQCSWEMIMSSPDGLGDSSDVSVIQALALLAVIDASAGRRRAAWVKIGMAVRISQDLQMMLEPDSLSVAEAEERRGIFWTLFLLDRFVCCSFRRPPAIKVSDCQLKLPVDRELHESESALTLGELLDENVRGRPNRVVGVSGFSVGFAALLGRTIDCMMNREARAVEPWQGNSDYSLIHTSLESLKQMADAHPSAIEGEQLHTYRTSHLVLSLTLYHLTHCILSHPYLLGVKRQAHQSAPTAWIEAQIASCWSHAQELTTLVVDAKAAGYMLAPSFYSYCILVAGTVHALLLHGEDKPASERASKYLKTSFDYLSEVSEVWHNSYIMSDALRFFTNRCVRYSSILLGPASLFETLTQTDTLVLRSVLDYWAMMHPRNPISELSSLNIDCFADNSGKEGQGQNSLSPDEATESPEPLPSKNGIENENPTVDPGVLVDFPLSISSPVEEGAGDSEFTKWDWDNELHPV